MAASGATKLQVEATIRTKLRPSLSYEGYKDASAATKSILEQFWHADFELNVQGKNILECKDLDGNVNRDLKSGSAFIPAMIACSGKVRCAVAAD